jgi:hypothetical protein
MLTIVGKGIPKKQQASIHMELDSLRSVDNGGEYYVTILLMKLCVCLLQKTEEMLSCPCFSALSLTVASSP